MELPEGGCCDLEDQQAEAEDHIRRTELVKPPSQLAMKLMMETIATEMNTDELLSIDEIQVIEPASIRRDLSLKLQNMKDLRSLQGVIITEEDRAMSIDEVLARVLKFYRRYVPFPRVPIG